MVSVKTGRLVIVVRRLGETKWRAGTPSVGDSELTGVVQVRNDADGGVKVSLPRALGEGAEHAHGVLNVGPSHASWPNKRPAHAQVLTRVDLLLFSGGLHLIERVAGRACPVRDAWKGA